MLMLREGHSESMSTKILVSNEDVIAIGRGRGVSTKVYILNCLT